MPNDTPTTEATTRSNSPETMTESTPTGRETEYRPTLGQVSHTNPYTGAVFGDTQTYSRGRTVAADGGEPEAAPDDEDDGGDDTLADVDHTPAGEVDGAQDTFDRGEETTSEPDDE